MRVLIVGKEKQEFGRMAREAGLIVGSRSPEAIICHGGDGTLLGAERDYPGVPKLAVRMDAECRKCDQHQTRRVLADLAAGRLPSSRITKLEAETKGRRIIGINDIIIHNADVFSAVRFKVWIGGELYSDEIVGDGLVIATPFGSSAYYRSITHSIIRSGIGLAFNNTTEPLDHLVLDEKEIVRIAITRGPAILGADNDPGHLDLVEGDVVVARKSDAFATVLAIDALLCNHCRRLDGRKWNRHGGFQSM